MSDWQPAKRKKKPPRNANFFRQYCAQAGKCYLCGRAMPPLWRGDNPDRITWDHVVPRDLGGPDNLGNLALAHAECNQRKGNRPPTAREQDRLLALRRRRAHLKRTDYAGFWQSRRMEHAALDTHAGI